MQQNTLAAFGADLKPLGDGFVKLVKMMIAPVVFCTIVSGITSLGDSREIGKTLVKAMGLFYALTIIALLTGLVAVYLMQPGAGMNVDVHTLDAKAMGAYAETASKLTGGGTVECVGRGGGIWAST